MEAVESITDIDKAELATKNNAPDNDTANITKPRMSKKYMIMGFVIGLFVYACGYLALILVKRRVGSADILESCTGNRILGEICCPKKSVKGNSLFHSSIVEKIRYRERNSISESVDSIVNTIEAIAEHEKINTVTLIDLISPKEEEHIVVRNNILSGINSIGLKANLIDATSAVNDKVLLQSENVILLVEKNTLISNVQNIVKKCNSYDIRQVGSIYFCR